MKELQVVVSRAGKDSGGFFVVLRREGDFAYIADGRLRKVENPKRKRLKHLQKTNYFLEDGSVETNKKLREALKGFGERQRRD